MEFKCSKEYSQKLSFADKVVKLVASGNSIIYALGEFKSSELDIALARRVKELMNVKIYPVNNRIWHYDIHRVDPREIHFYFDNRNFPRRVWESELLTKMGYDRMPGFIFMAIVSPMDKDGNFWLPSGIIKQRYQWEIEHAQYVILEINENVCHSKRDSNSIHINQVHYVVPSRNAPPINIDCDSTLIPFVNISHHVLTNPA